MKILYILHTAQMHGSTISFLNMVKGVAEQGVRISVILPKHDMTPDLPEALKEIGIDDIHYARIAYSWLPHFHPHGAVDYMRVAYQYLKLHAKKSLSLLAILRIARKVKPDIIHTNVGVVREGARAAGLLGIPHIFHIREYQDDFKIIPSKEKFEKQLRKSTTITITHLLQKYFNLDGVQNALTIYNGILPESAICYLPEKKKEFICASRISPEKGIDDVISAFSEFHRKHADYRLTIAGEGENWCKNSLKGLAEKKGCSDSVDFVGFVKDVPERMRNARALIVASHLEPFGRMTAEAIMEGCLVIGRNTGGTKEIMDNAGGALRFETMEELLSCMEKAAEMKEEEYLGILQPAQEKAAGLFTTEQNIRRILSLYEDTCGHSRI